MITLPPVLLALHVLLMLGLCARVLLRGDMLPESRVTWLLVIFLVPLGGAVLYFLLGEVSLGRRLAGRHRAVSVFVRRPWPDAPAVERAIEGDGADAAPIAPPWQSAFRYAASINGFHPCGGNAGELMADGDAARARMLADFDAAEREINVLYYIWLGDHTGTAVAEALMRAARRGVRCRAMADGLGSRAFIASPLWSAMRAAGVQLAVALPINHPLKVLLTSRIDLRNHRKITLVDGCIGYVGSQNCADAAFLVQARYAPWVDIMLRLQGPVVTQLQLLFASDWVQTTGDTAFDPLAAAAAPAAAGGFAAIAVGDGPTERRRSTPQLFATLMAGARRELTITTPYFVPDATVMDALCAAAFRGVRVTLVFPARNNSWIVAGASRSHYARLLAAGIAIYEFRGGLLHAKTLTVDGELTLIGSANIDLRSFDLNYENNVLLQDATTTAAVIARQQHYIAHSTPVTRAEVRRWPWWRRMWNNALAALGPVL